MHAAYRHIVMILMTVLLLGCVGFAFADDTGGGNDISPVKSVPVPPVSEYSAQKCASIYSTAAGKKAATEWCQQSSPCSQQSDSNNGSFCKYNGKCTLKKGDTCKPSPPSTPGGTDGVPCNYYPECVNGAQTYQWAIYFLTNFLQPFYEMIIIVARLIGIMLVFWGCMRCRRHGQHNMMYRLSPMATVMFFVVGAIFAAFMPWAMSFSGGIFGQSTAHDINSKTYIGVNANLLVPCTGQARGGDGSLTGSVYCPVLGYISDVQSDKDLENNPEQTMMQVVYAILLVIGVISFLRGCLFLLRLGEGNSQEGSMQKAVVHIIAGVIGMNAQTFVYLLQGITPSSYGSS